MPSNSIQPGSIPSSTIQKPNEPAQKNQSANGKITIIKPTIHHQQSQKPEPTHIGLQDRNIEVINPQLNNLHPSHNEQKPVDYQDASTIYNTPIDPTEQNKLTDQELDSLYAKPDKSAKHKKKSSTSTNEPHYQTPSSKKLLNAEKTETFHYQTPSSKKLLNAEKTETSHYQTPSSKKLLNAEKTETSHYQTPLPIVSSTDTQNINSSTQNNLNDINEDSEHLYSEIYDKPTSKASLIDNEPIYADAKQNKHSTENALYGSDDNTSIDDHASQIKALADSQLTKEQNTLLEEAQNTLYQSEEYSVLNRVLSAFDKPKKASKDIVVTLTLPGEKKPIQIIPITSKLKKRQDKDQLMQLAKQLLNEYKVEKYTNFQPKKHQEQVTTIENKLSNIGKELAKRGKSENRWQQFLNAYKQQKVTVEVYDKKLNQTQSSSNIEQPKLNIQQRPLPIPQQHDIQQQSEPELHQQPKINIQIKKR